MLKIETNEIKVEKNPKKPKYPYFGESEMGNIVLSTKPKTGMLVKSSNSRYAYAFEVFTIIDAWTESDFIPLENYSVTISTIN